MHTVELRPGFCHCGCGERAPIAKQTNRATGARKGFPQRYIRGHGTRGRRMAKGPDYVVDANGCWVWQHYVSPSGYGIVKEANERLAHRAYYRRAFGGIPEGTQLDHLCRNRACVNPAHLDPVTGAENVRRGRNAKLTIEQVREIRATTGTLAEIGARYGVTPQAIWLVKKRKNWRD